MGNDLDKVKTKVEGSKDTKLKADILKGIKQKQQPEVKK